jgi:glycosyltransferase involved in cell wall biosynthesis
MLDKDNNNKMKISLGALITYFNEKELLRECLESLIHQEVKPDEIIIYDDASTFPAKEYVPKDLSVKIISGESNRGPAYGRNVLLRNSQSDYIHFHDTDDLFCPDWGKRILQEIKETNADFIIHQASLYQDGKMVCKDIFPLNELAKSGDLVKFCLKNAVLTSTGAFRKSACMAIGGYRESLPQSEDYDFHIRLAASGVTYSVIEESLIMQRFRANSHSRKNFKLAWVSMIESIRLLSSELPDKYRTDLADAAVRGGLVLSRLGAKKEANEAFRLAYKIGRPTFRHEKRAYRILARVLGPQTAEQIASLYRKLMHH